MSSSTHSRLVLDCSALRLQEFVQKMTEQGWCFADEAMHLSPCGDESDWVFSGQQAMPGILDQLDNRGSFGGVVLWKVHGRESASFIVDWVKNELCVLWGAECPRDTSWPRAVDFGWIMSELRKIAELLPERPSSIEVWCDSP